MKKSLSRIPCTEMETPEGHCHSAWHGRHTSITKGIQVSDCNDSTLECERHTRYSHGSAEDQD